MYESCEFYDISCGLNWLADEFKSFFLWVYDGIISGFASIIESIPVPDFLANVGVISLPPGVAYFAVALEIPTGLTMIVAAYTARFLLRRIPGIG